MGRDVGLYASQVWGCDFNAASAADLVRLARGDNSNHSQYDTCCPDSGWRVHWANSGITGCGWDAYNNHN